MRNFTSSPWLLRASSARICQKIKLEFRRKVSKARHSPAEMVAEHLNVDPAMVPHWPGANAFIVPE
jgi:hypothetical protein